MWSHDLNVCTFSAHAHECSYRPSELSDLRFRLVYRYLVLNLVYYRSKALRLYLTEMATSCTSLTDIFDHCEIKKEDLEGECPREIRINIALKLTDWRVFGSILLLPKEKLASIDAANQSEDHKKITVLECWHEKESKRATSLMLAKKLYDHNRGDLVTHLCELVKSHPRTEPELGFVQPGQFELDKTLNLKLDSSTGINIKKRSYCNCSNKL